MGRAGVHRPPSLICPRASAWRAALVPFFAWRALRPDRPRKRIAAQRVLAWRPPSAVRTLANATLAPLHPVRPCGNRHTPSGPKGPATSPSRPARSKERIGLRWGEKGPAPYEDPSPGKIDPPPVRNTQQISDPLCGERNPNTSLWRAHMAAYSSSCLPSVGSGPGGL